MARITVEIEDRKAVLLEEKAKRFGLQPDQIVTASMEDLIFSFYKNLSFLLIDAVFFSYQGHGLHIFRF